LQTLEAAILRRGEKVKGRMRSQEKGRKGEGEKR